jgi:hypothetical protein
MLLPKCHSFCRTRPGMICACVAGRPSQGVAASRMCVIENAWIFFQFHLPIYAPEEIIILS